MKETAELIEDNTYKGQIEFMILIQSILFKNKTKSSMIKDKNGNLFLDTEDISEW